MNQTELTVRDAPGFCPGARVYRFACRHGVSSAALVPGVKPVSDGVVFDMVLPGHNRRFSCSCAPASPFHMPVTARA